MYHNFIPFVVKHHGSIKYCRLILKTNSVFRLKSSSSGATPPKIFAAAANPRPSSKPNQKEKKSSHTNSIIKNKNSIQKDVFESVKTEKKLESRAHDILTKIKSAKKLDAIATVLEPERTSKRTVKKLDVTATVLEPERTLSEKEKIKLVNSIKPANLEWHKQALDIKLLPGYYKSLAKFRLTGLVVLTTLAGYGMAPGAFDPTMVLLMAFGTGLTSAAANTINQVMEVPYDSQMTRTKNRVLIRGFLTPLHASLFAATCASLGVVTLYFGTNSLTTVLGLTNLVLYTSIYTPMKRYSIANTWLGSVVGAIPPLMGWAACTGSLNSGALLMAAILYSWQFPHFNALSWNLRAQYSRAGYRMTSVIDPALCRRVALRHSIALLGLCTAAPLADLTTWTFAFDSVPLNCYLIYCSYQFYMRGDSESSRKLFRLSLIYLPALMFLMIIGKKSPAKEGVEV